MTKTTALLVAALGAALARAADAPGPVVKSASELEWHASGDLPPGAEYALVYEDPKTHAVQTLVRMPKGYSIPAHSHSTDETIVVLKGKVILGIGGTERTVGPGGTAVIPAGTVFTMRIDGFLGGAQFLAAFSGPFDVKLAATAK